ncbi:PTS sugar transporter subunit IIB, partial [Staphylococcus epidermidis]
PGTTTPLLPNPLNKPAQHYQLPLKPPPPPYPPHIHIIKHYQLIILPPQVPSNYQHIKQHTHPLRIKLPKTQPAQYINLTRH